MAVPKHAHAERRVQDYYSQKELRRRSPGETGGVGATPYATPARLKASSSIAGAEGSCHDARR